VAPGSPPGLGLEDLEVVIEGEDFDVLADRPLVSSDQLVPVVDLNGARCQAHR